ncbi:MAG: hypothetical protein Q8O00_14920, partial [Holophaga sp.]|nr:hypothetical protein [Holophaga sp.]
SKRPSNMQITSQNNGRSETSQAIFPTLNKEAFLFLVKVNFYQARSVLAEMLSSKDSKMVQLGLDYLSQVENPMLAITLCESRLMAPKIGLSEFEWELAKRFRRAQAEYTPHGIVIPGYIDLSDIQGPMSIPIIEAERINFAYSSDITLPNIKFITNGFLNLVGSCQIQLPSLEGLCGDLSASRAISPHMPLLTLIAGDLNVEASENVKILRLEEIGGKLLAMESRNCSLPSLTKLGLTLNIRDSEDLSIPALKHASILLTGRQKRAYLPALQKIGRKFFDPMSLNQWNEANIVIR